MEKLLIYLDNCCYNRPFDDPVNETIILESEAKLSIQDQIRMKNLSLVWSFALDFENSKNPYNDKRDNISVWRFLSAKYIPAKLEIKSIAREIEVKNRMKSLDSLHLACAIYAKCEYFLTTDKDILRKSKNLEVIEVFNPVDFVLMWEAK
ncbi:MAG: hypothetical protein A2Y33_07980 [Spirochaetes bacterium GWF1_51_8]|nr:MAG: hypothetical protein A2Y33_07980 [Spirochaetes bacterium GWF1_51_8]